MSDPLSIVAGVAGITTAALHTIRRVKEFLSSIDGGPNCLGVLAQELEVFQATLSLLQNTLLDTRELQPCSPADQEESWSQVQPLQTLKPVLQNCRVAFEAIKSTIQPFVVKAQETKRFKWNHSLSWLACEKALLDMNRDVLSYKMSLDIAVSFATLLTTGANSVQLQRQIRWLEKRLQEDLESTDQGSSTGSLGETTEPGYALRRFLLDTESVIDSVNEPPTSRSDSGNTLPSPEDRRELESITRVNNTKPALQFGFDSLGLSRIELSTEGARRLIEAIPTGSDTAIDIREAEGTQVGNVKDTLLSRVFRSQCTMFDSGRRSRFNYGVIVSTDVSSGLSYDNERGPSNLNQGRIWWAINQDETLPEGHVYKMPPVFFRHHNSYSSPRFIRLVAGRSSKWILPSEVSQAKETSRVLGTFSLDFEHIKKKAHNHRWYNTGDAWYEGVVQLRIRVLASSLHVFLTHHDGSPVQETSFKAAQARDGGEIETGDLCNGPFMDPGRTYKGFE